MEVKFAHVCDYASISQEGKLSVMGIFDRIGAPQVPVVHPQMYVAFGLDLDYTEVGRPFTVEVQMVDSDGEPIWKAKAQGIPHMPVTAKPGDRNVVVQVIPLQGLTFREFGSYDVNIFTNGQMKERIQFNVSQVSPPQQP